MLAIDRLHVLLDVMKEHACPKCRKPMKPRETGVESDYWRELQWRCPNENCGGKGERFTQMKRNPPRLYPSK